MPLVALATRFATADRRRRLRFPFLPLRLAPRRPPVEASHDQRRPSGTESKHKETGRWEERGGRVERGKSPADLRCFGVNADAEAQADATLPKTLWQSSLGTAKTASK